MASRVLSNSRYFAPISIERSTEERTEKKRRILNRRYSLRTVDQIALDRRTVTDIQTKPVKWGKRGVFSRYLHTENDKETIATWRDSSGLWRAFCHLSEARTLQLLDNRYRTFKCITSMTISKEYDGMLIPRLRARARRVPFASQEQKS